MAKRDRTDYQRELMRKRRSPDGLVPFEDGGPLIHPHPEVTVDAQGRRHLANPYRDGLPDWPELISRLSTQQQNELLEKMPHRKDRF